MARPCDGSTAQSSVGKPAARRAMVSGPAYGSTMYFQITTLTTSLIA